ncbi:uncharacterized protein [Antedon mediterranea]|uniref:uncharacterized protein n=1 Tax=Antedon mediterranea TaxID=105859 RepID=UPI003AF6E670
MFVHLLYLLIVLFNVFQSGETKQVGNSTGCGKSFFQCDDNECIKPEEACNMHFDCEDFSDEKYCECTKEEFKCSLPSAMCISVLWKCDGEGDCNDNSDEIGCPCASDQFRCTDNFCIANQLRCDGVDNCADRSDESNCSMCTGNAVLCPDGMCHTDGCDKTDQVVCADDEFLCKGDQNVCISGEEVCQNIAYCSNSVDEFKKYNCGCGVDAFTCGNGFCISNDHRCDKKVDCSDNSDELNCCFDEDQVRCDDGRCMAIDAACESDCTPVIGTLAQLCGTCSESEFQCHKSKECIKKNDVCNGHDNCVDSSDETDCTKCPNNYRCESESNCYEELQICDGINDCSDGTDENECEYAYTCPGDGRKLRNYFICDGKNQCMDGSDEQGCRIPCGNGTDILRIFLCNGHYDCLNRNDERNCSCHGNGRCPNGLCMGGNAKCDGHVFCEQSSYDEMNCPCVDSEFTCDNGICIDEKFVCDGSGQCPDFSDEIAHYCSCKDSKDFKCSNGMCIPGHRICDGQQQCPDGGDEKHCLCFDNQFKCNDGTCIKKSWVCDHRTNCPDGSDETDCGCTVNEFTCADGSCIGNRFVCNGRIDCHADSSDEFNCTCTTGEYRCNDGQCVDNRLMCDGTMDCTDGTDEYDCSCSDSEFDCGDGECVLLAHKCNGRVDCSNEADEFNCKCEENEFHCHNGQCVAGAFVCDAVYDCEDKSDEASCKCKASECRSSDRICVASSSSNACNVIVRTQSTTDSTTLDSTTLDSVNIIPIKDKDFKIKPYIFLTLGLFILLILVIVTHKPIMDSIKGKFIEKPPKVADRRIISLPVRDHSYKEHEINRRCLQIGERLGHGKFGVVHKGILRLSKDNLVQVAVKSVGVTANQEQKEDFVDEIKLLLNIGKHPNIIAVIGCCMIAEPYLLITELMKYGDLLRFLRTCRQVVEEHGIYVDDPIYCLKETDMYNIARQVAKAMNYLSKTRYYHGDLAARNILVGENLTVKVSDFGLANDIYMRGYKRLAPERKRPIAWVSLETIREGLCTIQSDVWSFGVLLYEIITLGSPPYPDISLSDLTDKLIDGYRMPQPRQCPREVYEVMTKCWKAFPSQRPTFAELYSTFDLMLQQLAFVDTQYVTFTESDAITSDQMVKKRHQSESVES